MDVVSEVNLALMVFGLRKHIEWRLRFHTVGKVWYLWLPCLIC